MVFRLSILYISLHEISECDAEENCCNFTVNIVWPELGLYHLGNLAFTMRGREGPIC